MSWLRTSKKFRIGLVFGLILFVFLSIANIALAQMQPVYMGQEVTVEPITDLQAAERAVEAARLQSLLYDFSPRATWDWLWGNPNPAQQRLNEALEARTEAYVRQHGEVSVEAAQGAGVEADSIEALQAQIEENAEEAGAAVARNNQQFSNTVTISEIIGRMFAWLLYYIAVGLGWILMLITTVMLKIATYNNFLREGMVQSGWRIVRDICNNFFIILLLITAISTMLRQGEFKDWRGMLPKILVAAIVINFSLLMCGIFIDVSQIFTLTFASPLNTIPGYNVILAAMGIPSGMQLSKLLTAKENSLETTARVDTIDLIAALFYAVVTTFVTIVVIVAVTVILAYRIVWLWFLVILSPLPILLAIFKKGASYASQWWSEFTKYLIVGPVIMFFVYLSFMAMGQMDNTGYGGNTSNVLGIEHDEWGGEPTIGNNSNVTLTSGSDTVSLSNAASPDGLINFLIIIGLMVGSLMMAQKMGVGGSKFAGQSLGWLQKQGKRFTVGAAKSASKGLATAADDRLGARQKLYGAAFAAGGKFIPFAGQALGKRIGELEAGTQKRTGTKYGDLAKGYKVDDMNEAQLRKLASKGGARGVVAAQALMKKGLIRDNESDPKKEAENIKIITAARTALKGTDLGSTFDENMKKRNPKLALRTAYQDSKGKLDKSKIEEDVKNGKLDFANVMAVANAGNLKEIKELMGGSSTESLKYISNILGGDSKKIAAAIGKIDDEQIRKQIFGGVNATQIKAFAEKDEIDATGRSTGRKIADHKMLEGLLSALVENGIDVGKIDSYYDPGDEKARKAQASFIGKNASNLKDIYEDEIESGNTTRITAAKDRLKEVFDSVGDLLGKDAVEKLKSGGKNLKDAVDGAFNKSMQDMATNLNSLAARPGIGTGHADYKAAQTRLENLVEKGIGGGASFDLTHSSISGNAATVITDKVADSSLSDLSKMKYKSNPAGTPSGTGNEGEVGKILWDKMQPAAIDGLFEKKENIKLIKAIKNYVNRTYAKPGISPGLGQSPAPTVGTADYEKYQLISKYL